MAAIWVSNSGRGHGAEAQDEDLDVLPGGVEHLHHRRVGQQLAERVQVDARGLGVDHRDLVVAGKLHDAELRPVGALAHELGIDGDELLRREPAAERSSASVVVISRGRTSARCGLGMSR